MLTWLISALVVASAVPTDDLSAMVAEAGSAEVVIAGQTAVATPTDLPTPSLTPTATPSPTETPLPMAEEITRDCTFNGYAGEKHKLTDGVYKTYWESTLRDGVHGLTITAPKGKKIGGVLIRWKSWPVAVDVQVGMANMWATAASCDADFVAQYIEIPPQKEVRIISRDDQGRTKLEISEITVYTPGELPEDAQVWRKAPEKVDMMLLATHPDDEILWFGGLLPTYAGERGKDVLAVCGAHNSYYRRLELCDCLWACGVRIYPHFLNYFDSTEADTSKILEVWGGRAKVKSDLVALYRQYRPDVLVMQAVGGESGHPAHRILGQMGREAVAQAASAQECPESAELYGTWDVPKVYVHLWEENQLRMDWHVPLERFGGLDGMEVAAIAFDKHVSQRDKSQYSIHDGGDTDCSLFGLFHTTVGEDEAKNDLFEHIPARSE